MPVLRIILPTLALLAACAQAKPDPVASPQLDSGVQSSFGGATQVLGNNPNVGVTTRTR